MNKLNRLGEEIEDEYDDIEDEIVSCILRYLRSILLVLQWIQFSGGIVLIFIGLAGISLATGSGISPWPPLAYFALGMANTISSFSNKP